MSAVFGDSRVSSSDQNEARQLIALKEKPEDQSDRESRHEVRLETWMYRSEGATRAADCLMAKYKELTNEPKNEATAEEDKKPSLFKK